MSRPEEFAFIISAASIGCVGVIVFRSRMSGDVDLFISERQTSEAHKLLLEQQKEIERHAEVTSSLATLAVQTAHDIRSPLAALKSITDTVDNLPENDRMVLNAVTDRIYQIAETLIGHNRQFEKSRKPFVGKQVLIEKSSLQLIHARSVVDEIIMEKRFQYRTTLSIRIDSCVVKEDYDLFVLANQSELKRVLSNIIDNGVEALRGQGSIDLQLDSNNSEVVFIVSDNGKGIPVDVLGNLGKHGFSHDKKNGSGLGLYHAFNFAQQFGGSARINSVQGQKTIFVLTLPRVSAPHWFVKQLLLQKNSHGL